MPKKPYTKPAVIYQGVIKTRAGSGVIGDVAPESKAADAFDPAQIFK